MRMRQLTSGQSITTFAPPEVNTTIRSLKPFGSNKGGKVEFSDIIVWTMFNTLRELESAIPQWADQGIAFDARKAAWDDFLTSRNSISLKDAWIQKGQIPLVESYGSRTSTEVYPDHLLERINEVIPDLQKSNRIDEEQEREYNPEVEKIKEEESPPPAEAAVPILNQRLVDLVRHGVFAQNPVFIEAFDLFTVDRSPRWSGRLFVTADYKHTIQNQPDLVKTSVHIRRVLFVITVKTGQHLLISPFEAEKLIARIISSHQVTLSCFIPRKRGSQQISDLLDFFHVGAPLPKSITTMALQELRIFSGQLHAHNDEDLEYLTCFLGFKATSWEAAKSRSGFVISRDHRHSSCPFDHDPTQLMIWIHLMRFHGTSCDRTPVGKLFGTMD